MKIAIIGSGKIGSVLGRLWAKAGHKVFLSSRHPESLAEYVEAAGVNAQAGSISDSLAFGEIYLVSIPYVSLKDFGQTYGSHLKGKIVMETGNPYPERDGHLGQEVRDSCYGTGEYSPRFLPGCRLVRCFNSVWDKTLAKEAHRHGDRVGIPLASDDKEAMKLVASLVQDAGFEPVEIGSICCAKLFDVGTKVYDTGMTANQLRQQLNLSVHNLLNSAAD